MTKSATILMFVSLLMSVHSTCQQKLEKIKQHGSNPGNLDLFVYKPTQIANFSGPRPLVVVLHGCSQHAETAAVQSGWNKLADNFGFYVIYPQQKIGNNPNRCYNWFSTDDIEKNSGEAKSIYEMIQWTMASDSIDKSKIFIYGLSAGAAMGVALMADYPDVFNAGAILAGGAYMSATNPIAGLKTMLNPAPRTPEQWSYPVKSQNPQYKGKYPRMIVIHGKKDLVVDIRNSKNIIWQWTYLHQTDTIADNTTIAYQGHANITRYEYGDSTTTPAVIFYEVDHLGHALMVDPGDAIDQGGDTGIFAVDKDFHSTYWIAVDFGLIDPKKRKDTYEGVIIKN